MMPKFASYTGRSLAVFKRDFKKVSRLSPQKWLIQRRLEATHDKIRNDGKKVSDVCFEVGFKNLSHFSRVFKEQFGYALKK
jgi:AraC-like DNA-binding protein